MSLEQALADNTAALKEMTAALKAGGRATKPKADAAEAKPETKPEVKAEAKPEVKPEPGVDHKTVAEVVMDIANNFDRDSAVAILKKYNAGRCSELKAADLPAVFKEATAKRAELKAAAERAATSDSLV
jgi:hypothetical protein